MPNERCEKSLQTRTFIRTEATVDADITTTCNEYVFIIRVMHHTHKGKDRVKDKNDGYGGLVLYRTAQYKMENKHLWEYQFTDEFTELFSRE